MGRVSTATCEREAAASSSAAPARVGPRTCDDFHVVVEGGVLDKAPYRQPEALVAPVLQGTAALCQRRCRKECKPAPRHLQSQVRGARTLQFMLYTWF
jgi:hypothetical protein